jgi:hypothetical protein
MSMLTRVSIGVLLALTGCGGVASSPDAGLHRSPDAHVVDAHHVADAHVALDARERDATPHDARGADVIYPLGTPLPACRFPAASLVRTDASSPCWSVARTLVECGPCVTNPLGACEMGPTDGGPVQGDIDAGGRCVLACPPNYYGLADGTQSCTGVLPEGGTPPAPVYPPGCENTIVNPESNPDVAFSCCPCL